MKDEEYDGEISGDELLPGQMCYDELLFNDNINVNNIEENENIVLQNQINIDELVVEKTNNLIDNNFIENDVNKVESQSSKIKDDERNTNTIETQNLNNKEEIDSIENVLEYSEENNIAENDEIENNSYSNINYKNLTPNKKKGNMSDSQEKNDSVKFKPFDYEDGVIVKTINEVLHESMIPYTEHVVMDRALPRVEDGLKPVQRRILYSMLELGLTPDKQYRKSARIVGDCMGKYHPHGDSSVYDAMVRMSQDFSLRAPLVDGHGNFGSVDGDSAAAMRYTEAKLTPLAMELLRDLEKDTVHWSLNFDDTIKEPDMLPGRFPNLLVNGASGIAVGVATNIPPHNLGEVINGVVAYIDNNKISLDEMMKYIPAPDFPTGGTIICNEELKTAYETGKGKIVLRAKVKLEEEGDKQNLVITEIPYQVNKASLLQKIAELKADENSLASYIGEIRDESDRNGMRAVLKIKKGGNAEKILEYLFKVTQLEVSFGINMVAIANGKPKQLGLLDIISYYVEYQREIIVRRTKFDLDVAKDRAHIVEGLLIAIRNIDEVVKIIKKSSTTTEAKQKLKDRFSLSEKQAQAILDMRLARLVNLEITKLEQELKDLKLLIEKLTAIYNSKKLQYNTVKTEILSIKNKFSNPRRSDITKFKGNVERKIELKVENEIISKDVVVTICADKSIKSIPLKNYMLSTKELTPTSMLSDVHLTELFTVTTNKGLIFTNFGNVLKIDFSEINECKWKGKGVQLKSINARVLTDEYPISIIEINDNLENAELLFYTKKGMVKLSALKECIVNKSYYQAIKLKEDDMLINVEVKNSDSSVLMITHKAMGLHFKLDDVPVMGRVSVGVKGINLDDNDFVIFAGQTEKTGAISVLTSDGFGKKVPIGEYEKMARYRKGLRVIPLNNNANLIYACFKKEPKSIAIRKESSIELLKDKSINYDSRTSKGKQLVKFKFIEAFIYQV